MTAPVVLAAVDLGAGTATVIARAAHVARQIGGTVSVLHCVDPEEPGPNARRRLAPLLDADAELGELIAEVRVRPHTHGLPEAIAEEADHLDAAVIVTGRSQRPFLAQLFKGGTTVALLRRTRRPLLLARLPAERPYDAALVALDLTRPLDPPVSAARRLLGPLRMELLTVLDAATRLQLVVANVGEEAVAVYERDRKQGAYTALTACAARLAEPGWAPSSVAVEGKPEEEITRRLQAVGAEVLVLQPDQKDWLTRTLVGSLTETVLERPVDCDVLALPAPG